MPRIYGGAFIILGAMSFVACLLLVVGSYVRPDLDAGTLLTASTCARHGFVASLAISFAIVVARRRSLGVKSKPLFDDGAWGWIVTAFVLVILLHGVVAGNGGGLRLKDGQWYFGSRFNAPVGIDVKQATEYLWREIRGTSSIVMAQAVLWMSSGWRLWG